MTEYERPAHFRRGHLFDTESVRHDLWKLLLIFLGDREFTRITEEEFHADGWAQPLLGLAGDLDGEISKLLIGTASAMRVLDDRDAGELNAVAGACGLLTPDMSDPARTIPLTLREACNKILHAESFNFDLERLDGLPLGNPALNPTFLCPRLHLYGVHNGRRWKATLEIIDYVREGATVLR